MRLKKLLQGTAVAVLVAVSWIGTGQSETVVKAEETTEEEVFSSGNIKINPGTQTMSVTVPDGAAEVLYGVGTFNNNKGTVKVTLWDTYDATGQSTIDIDLSKLSNVKDNYIAVKTESSAPVYIKIGASVKKQKAVYSVYKHTLSISNIKGGSKNTKIETMPGKHYWQYRTTHSNWADIPFGKDDAGEYIQYSNTNTLFEEFCAQGAVLYVRAAASTGGAVELEATSKKVYDATLKTVPSDKDKAVLYDGGRLPGKESKITIAKQANGPSVSADYTKGTVTIPAHDDYRVLMQTSKGSSVYEIVKSVSGSSVGAKTPLTISDLYSAAKVTSVGALGVIEVRKPGKDNSAKGKANSKWTRVEIELAAPMALDANIGENKSIIATGSALSKISADGSVSVTGSKKNKVTITNTSTTNYEIRIDGSQKTSKLKAGKKVTITASNGQFVEIRVAGDKSKKVWAGQWTKAGSIKSE